MHRLPTILGAIALFLGSAAIGLVAAQTIWDEPAEQTAPTAVAVTEIAEPTATEPAPSQPASAPATDAPPTKERPAVEPAAPAVVEQPAPAGPSDAEIVERFVAEFSEAHATGDLAYLLGSIHPSIPHAFGSQACRDYVEATAGSITDMSVISVGDRTTYRLPSPDGAIAFDDAIPVEAAWTIVHSGEPQTITFHLAPAVGTGGYGWLTQCGVTVTSA